MNLNQQYVREVPMHPVFGSFEKDRAHTDLSEGGGFMFKNVHSIVMLSLHCFEKLFGNEGTRSGIEVNPVIRDDPYLENLLKLIPR